MFAANQDRLVERRIVSAMKNCRLVRKQGLANNRLVWTLKNKVGSQCATEFALI